MKYYKLTENCIPKYILNDIIRTLDNGGIIAYPTETVYGIGCNALNPSAVKKVYNLKDRHFSLPLIVLVHAKSLVKKLTIEIPEAAEILMDTFWPGPLTIILKASSIVPSVLTAEKGTIGIRVSPDPICMILLNNFKKPLVSTSANPSGSNPATSAKKLMEYFNSDIDIVIDGGQRNQTSVSTIIDLSNGKANIKRTGAIASSQIYRKIKTYNE